MAKFANRAISQKIFYAVDMSRPFSFVRYLILIRNPNMRATVFISVTVLFFLGFNVQLYAQNRDTLSRTERVEVITKYEPVLSDARKIDIYPEIEEPETSPPQYVYKLPVFKYEIQPMFKPGEPAKLKVQDPDPLFTNITKLGFGNYLTPLVDAHLHNGRSEKVSFGAQFRHLSSQGTPENADFSDNYLGIYGTQYASKYKLSGKLNYERNRFNTYGYDHDSFSFEADTLKRVFNQVHGGVVLDNYYNNKKIGNRLGADAYHFGNGKWSELDVQLWDQLKYELNKGSIRGRIAYRLNQTQGDSGNYLRHYVSLDPSYQFKIKKFEMDAGLRFTYFIDSAGGKSYVNPFISAQYPVVKDRLFAFITLDGGVQAQTLQGLSMMNQFMNGTPELRNSFDKYRFALGIRGDLYNKFDYVLSINQKAVENLAIFLADSGTITQFVTLYDDQASVFTFHSAFEFRPTSYLKSGFAFNYYNYNLSSQLQAWNLPDFDLNFNLLATIAKKWDIHSKIYLMGARVSGIRGETSATNELPAFADFNAGVDYRYSKKMAFFVNVNNITASRYQRWVNYPVLGLNALAGITITF